jgi:hypothetical protein
MNMMKSKNCKVLVGVKEECIWKILPTDVETLGTNRGIANKKFFPIIKVVL